MTDAWTIGRLNADATWWLDTGSGRLMFDPWLVGEEVDGWRWFHSAAHAAPVVPPAEVPDVDVVVVSQRYADHLHAATLARLPPGPVLAVPDAIAGVRAAGRTDVRPIAVWPQVTEVAGLRVGRLTRPWSRPPRYHAIVVVDAWGRVAVHAPHGLSAAKAASLATGAPVELLAITRQLFRLPFFLGGRVNPGPEAADRAVAACRARHLLAVHDGAKHERGLVARIAHVQRPEPDPAWLDVAVGEARALVMGSP